MSSNGGRLSADEQVQKLADAFLSLADRDECMAFFSDLFTIRELEDISSRLEVARLLKLGLNYVDIAARTGASTATISRVSKCLAGQSGGYRTVLKRLESDVVLDDGVVRVDVLSQTEADAVRAIVECLKKKNSGNV